MIGQNTLLSLINKEAFFFQLKKGYFLNIIQQSLYTCVQCQIIQFKGHASLKGD